MTIVLFVSGGKKKNAEIWHADRRGTPMQNGCSPFFSTPLSGLSGLKVGGDYYLLL